MDNSTHTNRYRQARSKVNMKMVEDVKNTGRYKSDMVQGISYEEARIFANLISPKQPEAGLHALGDIYERMRSSGDLRPATATERVEVHKDLVTLNSQIQSTADKIERKYREKGQEPDHHVMKFIRHYRVLAKEMEEDIKRLS
jgi:hypothetical protein